MTPNRGVQKTLPFNKLANRNCEFCGKQYHAVAGRQRYCKVCVPDKSARARMRFYRISQPQFEEQKKLQGHLCAICREEPPTVVDHDHATGKRRGLLCNSCNIGLAHLEDKTWHFKATQYLMEYPNALQIGSAA